MADTHLLIGRIALAALYAMSAWGKWFALSGVAAGLGAAGYPAPLAFALAAAAGELAGAVGVALGFKTRIAAYGLVVYTVLATLTFHAYWAAPDAATAEGWFLHAWKNVGLIGGFLLVAAAGPGRFSVDAWRAKAAAAVGPQRHAT